MVGYDFVPGLGHEPVVGLVLELPSGLLLVFIFTELVSTIRVVIARTVLLLGATVFALRIRRGEGDEPTTGPTSDYQ